MSPEAIISILSRLSILLEQKHHEQKKKDKKFKQLQMMLITLSSSVSFVLFLLYHAPIVQMLFLLLAFNLLFYIGFKPRTHYNEKNTKKIMEKIVKVQVALRKFIMGEVVSFDGVECSLDEGWTCDKWGLFKDDERIDYGTFLYEKNIKGLYLEALRNKK